MQYFQVLLLVSPGTVRTEQNTVGTVILDNAKQLYFVDAIQLNRQIKVYIASHQTTLHLIKHIISADMTKNDMRLLRMTTGIHQIQHMGGPGRRTVYGIGMTASDPGMDRYIEIQFNTGTDNIDITRIINECALIIRMQFYTL